MKRTRNFWKEVDKIIGEVLTLVSFEEGGSVCWRKLLELVDDKLNDRVRRNKMKAYHIATDEEMSEYGVSEDYDLLIGPNGFMCFLGEPEDRTWYRDINKVVVELNRLYEICKEK